MNEEIKVCGKCKLSKNVAEFEAKKTKRQPYCRQCNAEYGRLWYQKNRDRRKRILAEQKKTRIDIARRYVINLLRTQGCIDCGEKDPLVLEFDHKADKRLNVSEMISGGYNLEPLIAEIEKCEVRCSNCHRRKTARQFGYFKLYYDV